MGSRAQDDCHQLARRAHGGPLGQGRARGPRGDARGPVALACDEAPGQVGSSPRAKEVFLEKTEHLLDLHALSWYWAAGLLHRAASGLRTGRKEKPSADAEALVEEAAAHARAAERDRSGNAKEPRASLVGMRSLFHRPIALDPANPGDVVSPAPESSGDRRD